MAETKTKFKLNTLAQDLDMSTKDLVAIAEKCGITGLKTATALSCDMFDVILNSLTAEKTAEGITPIYLEYLYSA